MYLFVCIVARREHGPTGPWVQAKSAPKGVRMSLLYPCSLRFYAKKIGMEDSPIRGYSGSEKTCTQTVVFTISTVQLLDLQLIVGKA
jgi:hypothetical protein